MTSSEAKEYIILVAYDSGFKGINKIHIHTGFTKYFIKKTLIKHNLKYVNHTKEIGYIINVKNVKTETVETKKLYSRNQLLNYITDTSGEPIFSTKLRNNIKKLKHNNNIIFKTETYIYEFIGYLDDNEVVNYWIEKRKRGY